MKRLYFIILIYVGSLILGCSKTNNPVGTPKLDIEELSKSPTTLQIDSTDYSLSVFIWRDFMPISPIDGHAMEAVVNITTSDSILFPNSITADKLWVIDSVNVWETDLIDDFVADSQFQISKKASGGPKWETGIFVDAVVRLVQNDSIFYYLKAENIEIIKTN